MRGLKERSEEELDKKSIQELKYELAFRKERLSHFTPNIAKLAMKYVHRIEKILRRKEAAEQDAKAEIISGDA